MDPRGLNQDLELAFEMAELASEIALPLFHRGVATHTKSDGSSVTEADLEVERRLFEILARARPHDAVLSEESGALGASGRRWIVDPIDGTWLFAKHEPTWGTHIALEIDGEVVLGVITRPVAGQWWWAMRGQGAHRGALGSREALERLSVSSEADLQRARVMIWLQGSVALATGLGPAPRWVTPTLDAILEIAAGRLDGLVDFHGQPWDLAPALPIVEEAGGRFFDRDGGRRLDRIGGCFTNGRIDEALSNLRRASEP